MFLHTPLYFLFLALVVAIYRLLPWPAGRKLLLLVASYLFYALFDLRFALLLAALTAAVWGLGRAIPGSPRARAYAWLSVALNLGVLAVFKYANFFLAGVQPLLERLGAGGLSPGLSLLLPIGISFYTFQAISYTTEIYRKKLKPAENWLDFAVYMSFFPKLIAGPIVRPAQFFSQLNAPLAPLAGVGGTAAGLLLTGLVKKVIIADSLARLSGVAFQAAGVPVAGAAFATPLYIQGFYLYAIQIYADFSGYTDLARGSALLLGFSLPENFQQPYFATTLTAFWNRWHMSLTQWFREYLFFPLARSWLLKTRRKYPRLVQTGVTLVTMTLIGVWHGAAWTFVAWGVWHGVLLAVENLLNPQLNKPWQRALGGLVTFHLVGIGWVLFGSSSFAAAGRFLAGLLAFDGLGWLGHYLPSILLPAGLLLLIDWGSQRRWQDLPRPVQAARPVLVVAALVVIVALVILDVARGANANPFIYGQF